jgi:hypothetical protein
MQYNRAPYTAAILMNIKWFDRITNEDLWSITQQETIENQIKRRKWDWNGHTLRK